MYFALIHRSFSDRCSSSPSFVGADTACYSLSERDKTVCLKGHPIGCLNVSSSFYSQINKDKCHQKKQLPLQQSKM